MTETDFRHTSLTQLIFWLEKLCMSTQRLTVIYIFSFITVFITFRVMLSLLYCFVLILCGEAKVTVCTN